MSGYINNKDQILPDVISGIFHPVQFKPADPAQITGATDSMLGLGTTVTYKPNRSGNVLVMVDGNITDDTTGDLGTWKFRYGTGTAPANNAAASGTAVTPSTTWTALTGVLSVPFSDSQYLTLTDGTTYWFDFSTAATGGGAKVGMTQLTYVIMEF